MRRCTRCRVAFVQPRPTAAELEEFYTGNYFSQVDRSELSPGYIDYGGTGSLNAVRQWEFLNQWSPEVRDRTAGTLLELGAAFGDFSRTASADGWTPTCTELSDVGRQRIQSSGFAWAKSTEGMVGNFDLIAAFHVFEHMLDPAAELSRLRSLSKPDGLLVIEVPQWNSLGRRLRRSRWSQFVPPEHINFWTARSLTWLLSEAGWEAIRQDTLYPYLNERGHAVLEVGHRVRGIGMLMADRAIKDLRLGAYLRLLARPKSVANQDGR